MNTSVSSGNRQVICGRLLVRCVRMSVREKPLFVEDLSPADGADAADGGFPYGSA